MGTTRLGIFPSLNNKIMYDLVDKGFMEWFLSRFPNDMFTRVYIDNQSSVTNNYTLNKEGQLVPVNITPESRTPYVRMNVKHGVNNQSDVFGTDILNPNQQPGAFCVDTDLSGYRPIYIDPFGVIIALNERTVKVNFDITITVQTKSDQIGLMNYLDTFLKMNYVQYITVPTVIPVHNLMMEYLRSSIFKPEMLALDKSIDGSDDQIKFKQYINKMFMELMYDYSERHIKPYKDDNTRDVDSEGNKVDTMNYSYCYNQINRLYIKFDKYDADEGNKKNNAYKSFTVSLSGNYDFGIPISFITSVPAIIRGTRNNWYIKTSSAKNQDNYYHMLQFKEVYKENRHFKAIDNRYYRHFYCEKELLMSSKTEKFNIIDDIISLSECPSHYYIMKALLKTIESDDDFNSMFKVVIYKNNDPISKNLYKIDKNFNFTIYECDLMVPYYIDVFINTGEYQNRINDIRTKLENDGINWWNYFVKTNKNTDFNWFTNTIRDDFQSYLVGKQTNGALENRYRYTLNPYESNTHIDTGYRGIGYIPHYKVQPGTDDEFIPIIYAQFTTPDPQFTYYYKNSDNKYIEINTKDVEPIIGKRDIFIKVGKRYVECDPNKVMIPDPNYKYFIFDKNKNSFLLQEKLESFDPIQQYYIPADQYRYNSVNEVESW